MPDREKRKKKLEEWEKFEWEEKGYANPEARKSFKSWEAESRTLPIQPEYEPKLERLPIEPGYELEIEKLSRRKKKRF